MNLLNLFNTFTDCSLGRRRPRRDAPATAAAPNNAVEFDRQVAKTVAAITQGRRRRPRRQRDRERRLRRRQRAIAAPRRPASTRRPRPAPTPSSTRTPTTGQVNALGTDAIKVGHALQAGPGDAHRAAPRRSTPSPSSTVATTPHAAGPRSRRPSGSTRPAAIFVADVNHLKSKGSACNAGPDTGDGQGNCNAARTDAAAGAGDLAGLRPDRHRRGRTSSSSATSTPTRRRTRSVPSRRPGSPTSSTGSSATTRTRTCSTGSGATSTTPSASPGSSAR